MRLDTGERTVLDAAGAVRMNLSCPVLREPSSPLKSNGGSWGTKHGTLVLCSFAVKSRKIEKQVKTGKFEELFHTMTKATSLVLPSSCFMRRSQQR